MEEKYTHSAGEHAIRFPRKICEWYVMMLGVCVCVFCDAYKMNETANGGAVARGSRWSTFQAIGPNYTYKYDCGLLIRWCVCFSGSHVAIIFVREGWLELGYSVHV